MLAFKTSLISILLLYDLVAGAKILNSAKAKSLEIPAAREYFYVGGEYTKDESGQHHLSGQMYVERLIPATAVKHQYPIIFLHGQAQTGTNWLNTPDGRQGWASWFLQEGFEVYIADQPHRGRSPWSPSEGKMATHSAETLSMLFTTPRQHRKWPQAHLHTQWPGTGFVGDPIFDQFFASQVQFQSDANKASTMTQHAGQALLDRIGPAILVTHSEAGPLGFLIADAQPSRVKVLVSLEPTGPPFQNRIFMESDSVVRPWGLSNIPITYRPIVKDPSKEITSRKVLSKSSELTDCIAQTSPARGLPRLAQIPMLIVTAEASYHAPYDHCTVEYLRQGGVNVQHLNLSAEGFHGNGHLFFMERNNLAIASKVADWIRHWID